MSVKDFPLLPGNPRQCSSVSEISSLCSTDGALGFPESSAGKESACNAGDPGLIPGSGNSLGERISYPLEYSWASLVAQTVKNLIERRETWVQSLGWEDLLKEGIASHSSKLA